MRGVFVTGTDTGVGKTYVGAQVIRSLVARGIKVIPRKPVESGCEQLDGELMPSDAATLHAAAGHPGTLDEVCPYRLSRPLSPARAARLEGIDLTIADLERACRSGLDKDSFLWVEGAGGFYSPLAADGLNADLAARLGLPILLVAADRLGCINHVLLTIEAIHARRLQLITVLLNESRPSVLPAMNNVEDLAEWLHCPLFSISFREEPNRRYLSMIRLTEILAQ
jgi:dethiobiotin synthetase